MLLQTRDGIRCDLCGSSHKKKFVYYSMDCSYVQADTAKGIVNTNPTTESYDVCELCFASMVDKCRKHIRDAKKNAIRCDMCPTYLSGSFALTRVVLAKVTVDSAQKAEGPLDVHHKCMDFNICGKCWSGIAGSINKIKESLKLKGDWS